MISKAPRSHAAGVPGSHPSKRQSSRRLADPFRVIALISSYNEGDVISPIIEHLVDNGVDVYLLDNHSTDDTVEQASRWLGRGLLEIESFPAPGDERYGRAADRYDWTAILLRKEELARTLEANWFLHHDADEIRESPWEGVTLKEAIHFVDSLEYNCIDFRILDFPPVDDGFRQGMDPRTYFTHCREANASDQRQLKCWKSRAAISIVHFGGHDVDFEGKRPFPISFLLRHYPIRGQAHGQRKILQERKPRFSPDERAKSWHIQYDHVQDENHRFLVDPEFLRPFDLRQARLDVMLHNRSEAERTNNDRAVIARLQAKLAGLQEQLDLSSDALTRRDRERSDQIQDLNARLGGLASVEADLAESASCARVLRAEVEAVAIHRTELEHRVAELEARIAVQDSQSLDAGRRETALIAELEAGAALREALARRSSDLENALAVAQNQATELSTHVAALIAELAESQAARDSERAASARSREELAVVRTSKLGLERRASDLEVELAHSRQELDAGRTARQMLERKAGDLAVEVTRLRQQLGVVFASRTWRWGEPIGRLIQSLGVMRRPRS